MLDEIKKANHAPVGLLGFALTTFLLNMHNVGLFENSSMIIGMGVFYGGLAQLICGILEFKENRNFTGVAFTSYGSFWLTLCSIWIFPNIFKVNAPDNLSMAWYLFSWGMFTLIMFLGSLKLNTITKLVFGTLTALFFLLAIENFYGHVDNEMMSSVFKKMAGITGIICASFAFYDAAAQILSPLYNNKKFPLT